MSQVEQSFNGRHPPVWFEPRKNVILDWKVGNARSRGNTSNSGQTRTTIERFPASHLGSLENPKRRLGHRSMLVIGCGRSPPEVNWKSRHVDRLERASREAAARPSTESRPPDGSVQATVGINNGGVAMSAARFRLRGRCVPLITHTIMTVRRKAAQEDEASCDG